MKASVLYLALCNDEGVLHGQQDHSMLISGNCVTPDILADTGSSLDPEDEVTQVTAMACVMDESGSPVNTRKCRQLHRKNFEYIRIRLKLAVFLFVVFAATTRVSCQYADNRRNSHPLFNTRQQGFSLQNQLFNDGPANSNRYEPSMPENAGKQRLAAPQNLRAAEFTDTSVRLSWSPPFSTDSSSPAPEHYVIHYREKNPMAAELQVVGIDSNSYVLMNLQPSTMYQANVRAVRGGVQSAESDVVDFETRNGNAPTDVEAAAISQDTIKVAWKPPIRPSTSSQLQGYNIYYTRDPTLPSLSSWQSREVRANSQQQQQQNVASPNSASPFFPTSTFISDLLPRTLYTLVVEAIYYPTEREGTVSRPIVVKTQVHIPSQPRDVVVERLNTNTDSSMSMSPNTVRVRWRMPSQALLSGGGGGGGGGDGGGGVGSISSVMRPPLTGYDVHFNASISQHQPAHQRTQRVGPRETSADLRDLLPGTDYHIWVEAVARQGAGPPSEVHVVRTLQAPPSSAPQSILVDPQDATALKVRWQPPADDKQHGTIRSYKVFYKPTDAAAAAAAAASNVPSGSSAAAAAAAAGVQMKVILANVRDYVVTLDGLQAFTRYTVWMTASNDAGESPESEMVTAETLESVPEAPEELTFYLMNATTVQITWEEPKLKKADIRYYMVYWSEKGTSAEQEIGPVWVPGERRVTIGEWRPGREYRVQVVAFGTKGDGERSKVLRIQLPSVAPPAPLLHVEFDESQLRALVKWSGPDGYEHDIIGYRLAYGEAVPAVLMPPNHRPPLPGGMLTAVVDDTHFVRREMSKTDTELIVQGLERGKKYQFRVAASFAARLSQQQQQQSAENDGDGAAVTSFSTGERMGNAAVQELTIPEGIPEAPPTNIRYQFDQQKQLTFVWDPPPFVKRNGIISHYHVEVFGVDDYYVDGTTFSPFAGNSGLGRETLKFNITTETPRFLIERLRAQDKYLFRVAAATTRGAGPFSSTVFAEMPLEVPRPPAGINATAVNRTAAEIWWTPVKMPIFAGSSSSSSAQAAHQQQQQQQSAAEAELMQLNNAAAEPTASRLEIRGYKVYYSKKLDLNNMESWRSIQVRGADSWRVRIGDLEENATYAVIVAAETAIVTGYLSEHIQFRVNPELVPRELHAVSLSKDSITLAWQAPLRGSVAYYKVTCEGKRDFLDQHGVVQAPKVPPCQPVNVTNNATQVRLEHLVPYTNYIFSLMTIPVAQPSYVPPVMLYNQTSADVPNHLLPPKLASGKYNSQQKSLTGDLSAFVELQLERASEKRGPVEKYWVVVVPVVGGGGGGGGGEMRRPEDYMTQELLDGSDVGGDSSSSSSSSAHHQPKLVPYVAASFAGESLPNTFVLGDNERYGTFQNHRLIGGGGAAVEVGGGGGNTATSGEPQKYRTFLRVFVRKQQNDHSVAARSDLIFKSSEYSDVFVPSTAAANGGGGAALIASRANAAGGGGASLLSGMDAEKVPSWIWIIIALGAIFAVILCSALVIMVVSRRRSSKRKQQQQQHVNGGTAVTKSITGYQNGTASRQSAAATRMPPNGSSAAPHVHYQAISINGGDDSTLLNTATNGAFGFTNNNITPNSATITMMSGGMTPTPITMVGNGGNGNFETQPFLSTYGTINRNGGGGGMALYDGNNTADGGAGDFTAVNNNSNISQLVMSNGGGGGGGGVISDEFNAEFDAADSDEEDNLTTSSHRSSSIFMQHQLQLQQQQRDPVEEKRAMEPTLQLEKHPPISVGGDSGAQQLAAHVAELKANENFLFSTEFESIETSKQFTWHNSLLEMNKAKNRYANVVAYDQSRVVLKTLEGIPCSDYINASYCDGYRRYSAYIATQGPLPETFGDFWRMVWEQDTHIIIMLTRLEERGRLKCDEYWPSRTTETYGLMHVTPGEQQEMAFYTLRNFSIQPVGHPGEPRHVRQIQFTAWPDHGVPDSATPFLAFVQRVRTLQAAVDSSVAHHHSGGGGGGGGGLHPTGPTVIHCSAGVGRTGAYIVVDAMLQRLRTSLQKPSSNNASSASPSSTVKSVDIYGHVSCLREQRNFMVQTEDQYIFIYDAVLEAVLSGLSPTDIPVSKFYKRVQQKLLRITPSGYSLADVQFERLNQFCGRSGGNSSSSSNDSAAAKFTSATLPCNKYKNRLVNILPQDATRACLQPLPGLDGSDYINASYIDGYRLRNAYIATQAPLKTTVDDFWRLIWEHNSTIIVMLTKCREMGVEKSEQYWPAESSARYLNFVVYPIAEYSMLQYVLREFRITDARDGQSRTVRQFQYTEWPEQAGAVPQLADPFIDFIGQVHKTKEQFGQDGPITVHCSAGVGRTGVFIGLSIILERLQYENAVDVFTTAKLMRAQRMHMVQTEEQYKFLYTAVLNYLSSFEGSVA